MNALPRIQCCLAAIAIHAVALSVSAAAGAPVTVKVRLDRDSYVAGEPILLLLEFENHSDKRYLGDLQNVPGKGISDLDGGMEYALRAVLKGPDGFVQTWRPRFRRNPNTPRCTLQPLIVWPHEREQCTIILSRVFRPTAPGEYELNWTLDVPIRDSKLPLDRPSKGLRVEAEGTAKLRVGAANREALEKRADALLAEAQREKVFYVPSLFFLATMPPDIAMPRFRRFFNLKNTKKQNGRFAIAVHALVYVDTKEAFDLIVEVDKWTYQFSGSDQQPPKSSRHKGYMIHREAITSLGRMYCMTNKPELWRYIRKSLQQLAPGLLNEPEITPNPPST